MPIYVYETIPENPGDPVRQFELWQSMKDAPYARHPETGERLRRVVIGGIGMPGSITDRSADKPDPPKQVRD